MPGPIAAVLAQLSGGAESHQVAPYVIVFAVGFLTAIAGHLFRLRWMVALGILMILAATLLLPIAINLFEERPEPPGPRVPQPY